MLGKLLKYEVPVMGRKLLPLYAGLGVSALAFGLLLSSDAARLDIFYLPSLLLVALIVAVFCMTAITIIQRYSKGMFGDEAYFNQVLPATVTEHLVCRIISAAAWYLLSALMLFVSVACIYLVVDPSAALKAIYGVIEEITPLDWCYGLLTVLKFILAIYAAITVGHQARTHTLFASIAAYIGLLVLEGAINLSLESAFSSSYSFSHASPAFVVAELVLCVLYFLVCKYLLENRLNLE